MTEAETAEKKVVLNEADKKIIRCQKCGHFLMEAICPLGYFKVLCRQSECKTYNHITIEKDRISITLEPKKDIAKY
jgi:phage FluMu protein Com